MLVDCINDKIIEPCDFNDGDYLNTVFLRKKKDSTIENPKYRMILNIRVLC